LDSSLPYLQRLKKAMAHFKIWPSKKKARPSAPSADRRSSVVASVIFSSTLLLLSLLPSSCSFGNSKLFNIICITTARKIICSSHGFFIHLFFMRQRDEKLWIDPCMLCQLYSKIRPMYQNGPSLQEVVNPINYPVKQNEKNKPVKITNHRRRHRHVRKCKQNELPDVHACTSKQQF
jgi:hypothetical protein